jgi:hypothetical protein
MIASRIRHPGDRLQLFGCQSYRAIEADRFAVEHFVADDLADQ